MKLVVLIIVIIAVIGAGIITAENFFQKLNHFLSFAVGVALDLSQRFHFSFPLEACMRHFQPIHLDLYQKSKQTYRFENKHFFGKYQQLKQSEKGRFDEALHDFEYA